MSWELWDLELRWSWNWDLSWSCGKLGAELEPELRLCEAGDFLLQKSR